MRAPEHSNLTTDSTTHLERNQRLRIDQVACDSLQLIGLETLEVLSNGLECLTPGHGHEVIALITNQSHPMLRNGTLCTSRRYTSAAISG